MKNIFLSIASVILFAGCLNTASNGGNMSSLSESEIKSMIAKELKSAEFVTKKDVEDMISSKIVSDSTGMSDEDFDAKVAAGIQSFIEEQEEAAKKAQAEANKPKKVEGVSADDDPFIGDPNAPVTIIEFSDYECPFCSRHIQNVYPEIKEKYIDTGKVKYVFRDFPLGFHQNAIPAAVAANCVLDQSDNEAYFEFHDKLFADQKNLNEKSFKKYADELGLDASQFASCLEINDDSEVQKDMAEGAEYGISGTPGFFINGWQIKGAYPYPAFEELIEKELAGEGESE